MNLNRFLLFACAFSLLLFTACKDQLKFDKIYGRWEYTRLEHPSANPPSTEPDWKLKIEHPYIMFSGNVLTIWWDDKVLSHGTFRVDAPNILYKEILPDGSTREFPFFVSKLTDTEIIFETLGTEGARVTATRRFKD